MRSPRFVFLSQAVSRELVELAAAGGEQGRPVWLVTGSPVDGPESEALVVRKTTEYDNSSYRSRARTWLAYLRDAERAVRRVEGRPVLVVTTNPPLLPWLAWLLKRRRGWRYVVDVLDVYPDALVGQGLAGASSVIPAAWRRLNRLAFDAADEVVTLGPVMAERVAAQRAGRRAPRIIPSWVDIERVRPVARAENPFAREHGLMSGLTLLYSGNLGVTHDLSGLVGALEALPADAGVRAVFIGGGARREELAGLARRLASVTVLPYQPAERVPMAMASGDVGVVTLGRGAEGVSMPSKAAYMMAAGLALLGLTYGDNDVARLIEEHECGLNVRADDRRAVAAAIERFRAEPAFLEKCQENARRAAVEHFSREVCLTDFLEVLERASGGREPRA